MKSVAFYDSIPDFFYELNQENVLDYLDEMSLFYQKGDLDKTVVLSTMLHGNETSGLFAIQKFLKSILPTSNQPSYMILLGNPKAFHQNKRLVENQLDRNRIWQLDGEHEDHELSKQVIEKLINFPLVCAIDIHNNTGKNPYFCCVNRLDKKTLGMASLFEADALFFENPSTAFTTFMGRFCPSVTLECGMSGDAVGVEKAFKFISSSVVKAVNEGFLEQKFTHSVFKSFGKFRIPESTNIVFKKREKPNIFKETNLVWFFDDLEKFNLKLVPTGEKIGEILGSKDQVRIESEFSEDLFEELFELKGTEIIVKHEFYAAMVTKNVEVAKSDCFFYFLKKVL
jgi:succinylglutamate desuccinylase